LSKKGGILHSCNYLIM